MTGDTEILEDRIPQEDMINVPKECNSSRRRRRSTSEVDVLANNC